MKSNNNINKFGKKIIKKFFQASGIEGVEELTSFLEFYKCKNFMEIHVRRGNNVMCSKVNQFVAHAMKEL